MCKRLTEMKRWDKQNPNSHSLCRDLHLRLAHIHDDVARLRCLRGVCYKGPSVEELEKATADELIIIVGHRQ